MRYIKVFLCLFLTSFALIAEALPVKSNPVPSASMVVHVLRLLPGEDPKAKLDAFINEKNFKAAVVLTAVGSLSKVALRYANQDQTATRQGHFEIVSLTGTLGAVSGSHLHMSVSDKQGQTSGGHLVLGSKIYTTMEVAIGELTDVEFKRELDPATTYKELKVLSHDEQ